MSDLHDDLSVALKEIWPEGVPERELMLAGRLSAKLRLVVGKRLRAVTRWMRDSELGNGDVVEAIAAAGLSKSRFYAVAADWRRTRSIGSLGARAAEKTTRPGRLPPDVASAATEAVRKVMEEVPDSSVAAVVERLAAAGIPSLSYSAVRRLWLEAKRSAPAGPFGARLLFDSVGLDAVLDGERMRLYVVLDEGTGLVLGSAEATNRSRSWGLVHAADDARINLGRMDLKGLVVASHRPEVVLNLQRDDEAGGRVLERRLVDAGIGFAVGGGRNLGRATVRALGERAGPVWLGAGERDDEVSYRNGRKARMPEYTAAMSQAITGTIEQHNQRRMAATRTDASSVEPLDHVRRSIASVVTVVSGAVAELEALPSYSEADMHPGV